MDPRTQSSVPATTDPQPEIVEVRTGMFGAEDGGDTSGYGGLTAHDRDARRQPAARTAAGSTSWPTPLGQALAAPGDGPTYDEAIEKVVVDRGELTLHVRRDYLPQVAQQLRDDPALRFEICMGVSGVHYPQETGRELHAVYHLLSITNGGGGSGSRSSVPTPTRTSPRSSTSTPATTGTSARPGTCSGSSSTATRP